MRNSVRLFTISVISLACSTYTFAAVPVDLTTQPQALLQSLLTPSSQLMGQQSSVKEISTDKDIQQNTHIRFQQMYAGYRVWGADGVAHIPKNETASLTRLSAHTTMNGTMYQRIDADLSSTPAYALTADQANKALQHAASLHQKATGFSKHDFSKVIKELIVYVDKNNKAHWAYYVMFASGDKNNLPAVPTYILDAATLAVYESWNNLQTLEDVTAGGFGGNPKMQKLVYDGLKGDYPVLAMQRDSSTHMCSLQNGTEQNPGVVVMDGSKKDGMFSDGPVIEFKCDAQDSQHNNLFWDAELSSINGGYSPANDALYIGQVIKEMYQKWYNLNVLMFYGMLPMPIKMNVHANDMMGQPMDNAYFLSFDNEMYFGDGVKMFYPLTSLGVGAHEISHGFTSQHSNLAYEKQSGGLNESFSDMAAQAAEFYSTGHNNWQIGPEIVKGEGALRYMDNPPKDGKSIGNIKDYNDSLNVHYSSGVFNKAFYLLATSQGGWNAQQAFNVMVEANLHYWTSTSTFQQAACGVVKATTTAYPSYDVNAVKQAFAGVGITDLTHC